jgi:uncharacterized OB-fold protein
MEEQNKDRWVVDGQLALPYQYFAGTVGSHFLTSLRDRKKILGQRCPTCNKVFVPPRQTCERCFANLADAWVELSDVGEVTGVTVINYQEKYLPLPPPYALALIKLGGADTPLTHVVAGVDPANVKVGMKVKAVFADERKGSLLDIKYFTPA